MRDGLPPPPRLGDFIRKARKAHRLTLEQVAERSGVSKSMLSQIERGSVNPTFAVVWNLMQALGLDMADLMVGAPPEAPVIEHVHAYSMPTSKSRDGLVTLHMLSPFRTVLPVEWYEMRMEKGGALISDAHAPGTYEHLTCLDGSVAVEVGDMRVEGRAGDTLRYHADRPHSILNTAPGPSRAMLLVALPQQFDAGPV
ncbi:MAG: helix-turn-helix transcriptional regulator [Alphaproteobacteria bacterium]|uniref:helix-turn-helix domain-containing protein n=1 Tax=Pacificispira sp. TaxID=2888761 RepID=UPI001B0D9045|nr:helix-turn-helix transcriptional regulator [Alphaproteobacteria bacterium]MBO6865342.1 helix-turn-helix transcriptional regulator [Alphaproteobacteria bacterium]MEC9267562.1 XRE family transcriptional regulator [Pseudomonadota bacterium]